MRQEAVKPHVDIRHAEGRFATDVGWLDSKHSFSFGNHVDRNNVNHGLLLVNNDDTVQAGTGFDTHPHRDMEIVTWVLDGSLVHQDSAGNSGIIYPGLAQRMSAGRGIRHSEKNDSWRIDGKAHEKSVHFVQMWVVPDEDDIEPSYEQAEVEASRLSSGLLVPVASGMAKHVNDTAVTIRNRHAAFYAARLQSGQTIELPDAPFVHLFVPTGAVELEGSGSLGAGDAVRLTGVGGQKLSATGPAEILVWEMHATIG